MALTLTVSAVDHQVQKAQIVAAYGGIELKIEEVKALKSSPTGRGPALATSRGTLVESNAIARYLAKIRPESGLYGGSVFEASQIDQWLEFARTELESGCDMWLKPVLGLAKFNGKDYGIGKARVGSCLRTLNNYLKNNTYLVGNQVTLADISIAVVLAGMYSNVFAPAYIKKSAYLTRWFKTIVNQPHVSAVLGEIVFATAEKKAAIPEKKAQQQKKAKKPAAAPAPKKEKKVNPLVALPKSSMDLVAEKKLLFKKRPYDTEFFNTFWDRFDAAGYSVFESLYQYNSDNVEFWRVQNALGGFLQRSEACRKWALGVQMVLGENEEDSSAPFALAGCWIFRGPKVPAEMDNNPDAEYYNWVKLDTTLPENRQKVLEYFQKEQVGGVNVLDRRFFK